jgi:hypothetical protein
MTKNDKSQEINHKLSFLFLKLSFLLRKYLFFLRVEHILIYNCSLTRDFMPDLEKKKVGRPLKFDDPVKLEMAIDSYFEDQIAQGRPFTLTGLALALDVDRRTLYNYSQKDKFFPAISRGRQMCEQYAAEHLFTGRNTRGAEFTLNVNHGWTPESKVNQSGEVAFVVRLPAKKPIGADVDQIEDAEVITEGDSGE